MVNVKTQIEINAVEAEKTKQPLADILATENGMRSVILTLANNIQTLIDEVEILKGGKLDTEIIN